MVRPEALLILLVVLVIFAVFYVPLFLLSFRRPKLAMYLWVLSFVLFSAFWGFLGYGILFFAGARDLGDNIFYFVLWLSIIGFSIAFVKMLADKRGVVLKVDSSSKGDADDIEDI